MSTSEVAFLLVTPANASLLNRVDADVFDHAIQPQLLASFLAMPNNLLVVGLADEEVVGMASGLMHLHPDKPLQLLVNEVSVSPSFQRRGIGKRLVVLLLERAKELGCHEAWVANEVSNTAARALYMSTAGKEDQEQAVVYDYPLQNGTNEAV